MKTNTQLILGLNQNQIITYCIKIVFTLSMRHSNYNNNRMIKEVK